MEGRGRVRSRAYMDMTIPGVQKPHCEPCALAMRSCTGCSRVLVEPMPSTVVTASPCIAHTGARHAFTAIWLQLSVKESSMNYSADRP